MTNKSSRDSVLFVLLLATIAFFYAFTIRPGDPFSDDFAQYAQHAKNISDGAPYGRMLFIFHEDAWNPGPRVYPPIFPILLAPIYRTFGLTTHPMKLLVLAFFLAAMVVIYLVFRGEIGARPALIIIAIIGFNPFFWNLKDSILSDVPFLFFCYLALMLVEKMTIWQEPAQSILLCSVPIGILMYLACGTRTVGIGMIPAVLVWGFIRYGRIMKSIAVSAVICLALIIVEAAKLHTIQAAIEAHRLQTHDGPIAALGQVIPFARFYLGSLGLLWSSNHVVRLSILAVTLILAFLGVAQQSWRKLPIHAVFAAFYLPSLLNAEQMRYLIPVIPIYLVYALHGTKWLIERLPKVGIIVAVIVLGGISTTYALSYRSSDLHHLAVSTESSEAQQMFFFIKTHTGPEDTIEFISARTMALYTERKSSQYPRIPKPTIAELSDYLCQTGVTYLVIASFVHDSLFDEFVERNEKAWSLQLSNPKFKVYRLPRCKFSIARVDHETTCCHLGLARAHGEVCCKLLAKEISIFWLSLDSSCSRNSAPLLLPFGAWWLVENDFLGTSPLEGQFEGGERAFVAEFLKPGMTALDIGAHKGLYSLICAFKVGESGCVLASEPSPRELKRVKRTFV